MKLNTGLLVTLTACAAFESTFTLAQENITDSPTASQENSEESSDFEKIMVTAQKRRQSLVDVPLSLAVITGVQLERAQITSIQDLQSVVPSLSISQFGGPADVSYVFIRGLGNNTATQTLRAAAIVDDVPITDFRSINSNFLDVEQIEVLRGPQSTLYGLTAEAGLIVVKSRKPGDELYGKIAANYNSFGDINVSGTMDIPIVEDELTLGVSVFKESVEGFVENQFFDDNYDSGSAFVGRLRAIYTPSEELEFDLTYTRDENDADSGQVFVPVDRDAYQSRFNQPVAAATSDFPYTSLEPLGANENAADYRGFAHTESDLYSLRINYEAESFTVVSVTSGRDYFLESSFDIGNQPGGVFPGAGPSGPLQAGESAGEVDSFYQEFRFVSNGDNRLNWIVGGVYFSEDRTGLYTSIRSTQNIPSPPFPPIPPNTEFPFGDGTENEYESFSVFGQFDYKLSDNWEVQAGLRWETTESKGRNTGGFDGGGGLGAPVEGEILDDTFSAEQSASELLPRVTLSYIHSSDLRIYGTVAKSWLPGSAEGDPTQGSDGIIDPETSTNYEIGFNASIGKGRGQLTGAVYRNEIEDYQEAINVGPVDQFLENVAEVEIQGYEIEGYYQITDNFRISGGYAYNDATYGDFVEDFGAPFGTINRKGNRLATVPEYNFNVAGTLYLTSDIFAEVAWTGAGEFLERQDRTGGNGTNLAGVELQAPLGTFDSYDIVNFRLGYEGDNWSVLGYINNIFDEEYFTLVTNTFAFAGPGDVYLLGAPGRPTEFGVNFTYQFWE